jgi:hypothetical protein
MINGSTCCFSIFNNSVNVNEAELVVVDNNWLESMEYKPRLVLLMYQTVAD